MTRNLEQSTKPWRCFMNPLRDYGLTRMISEARDALGQFINHAAMAWLPNVREHFRLLAA
jgi:hypothetical protein